MKSLKILNLKVKKFCEQFNLEFFGEDRKIEYLSKINNRTENHENTLSFALNKEFYEDFLLSGFKILVLDDDLYSQIEKNEKITYIIASSPKKTYFELNNFIVKNNKFEGISGKIDKTSFIDPTSFVDNNVQIGSNVHIGKNCSIYKNTIIESGTHIGDNCVIGTAGFDVYQKDEHKQDISESVGGVKIESNVRIKNFTNIDRGSGGRFTTIKEGVAIGSFVHIAHDVVIEIMSTIIDSCTISGHVKIGRNVLLGINTTILQSISIGDYASTGIGTVVTTDLKSNKFMIGNPGRVIR